MPDENEIKAKTGLKKGIGIAGKILKWGFIVLGVLTFIVICLGVYMIKKDDDRGADPAKMSSEAVPVSAVELWTAYEENAARADNTFGDKFVRLTGTVTHFGEKRGTYFLDLEIPVRIYFKDSEQAKLAGLVKGQSITVVGNCGGEIVYPGEKDHFFPEGSDSFYLIIEDAFLE